MMSGAADARHWYVIQTKPRQELRAEANLSAQGVEILVPKYREPRVARGGMSMQSSTRPLFPGYVFARFDAAALVTKVRSTRGVHRVVGFGESATPVDNGIVALVRSRLDGDGFVQWLEPAPGDAVEIVGGPLHSLMGIFEKKTNGTGRVMILLSAIQSSIRLEVPQVFVRRCNA